MNILEKIVADKKKEVALKKGLIPVSQLEVVDGGRPNPCKEGQWIEQGDMGLC